jgi:hypothetical protein
LTRFFRQTSLIVRAPSDGGSGGGGGGGGGPSHDVRSLAEVLLWQAERKRLWFFDVVLYDTFRDRLEYDRVRDFAASIDDALVWSDDHDRRMCVSQVAHERVWRFVNES